MFKGHYSLLLVINFGNPRLKNHTAQLLVKHALYTKIPTIQTRSFWSREKNNTDSKSSRVPMVSSTVISTLSNMWCYLNGYSDKLRETGITPQIVWQQYQSDNRLLWLYYKLSTFTPQNIEEAIIFQKTALALFHQNYMSKSAFFWDKILKKIPLDPIIFTNYANHMLVNSQFGTAEKTYQLLIDYYKNQLKSADNANTMQIKTALSEIYNNLGVCALMNGLSFYGHEHKKEAFLCDKERSLVCFKKAIRYGRHVETIVINYEITKLMNWNLDMFYPEKEFMPESIINMFEGLRHNLLKYASRVETSSLINPILNFGGGVGFTASETKTTKINSFNLDTANQMLTIEKDIKLQFKQGLQQSLLNELQESDNELNTLRVK